MKEKVERIVESYQRELSRRGLALDEEQERLLRTTLQSEFSKKYNPDDPIDLDLLNEEWRDMNENKKRFSGLTTRVVSAIYNYSESLDQTGIPTHKEAVKFYGAYCNPVSKASKARNLGRQGVRLLERYLGRTGYLESSR